MTAHAPTQRKPRKPKRREPDLEKLLDPSSMVAELQDILVSHALDVPCLGPDWRLWASEDLDERAVAVAACGGCPDLIREACRDAGSSEKWGVWGGVDRAPRTGTRKGALDKESSGKPSSVLVRAYRAVVGHNGGHKASEKTPKAAQSALSWQGLNDE